MKRILLGSVLLVFSSMLFAQQSELNKNEDVQLQQEQEQMQSYSDQGLEALQGTGIMYWARKNCSNLNEQEKKGADEYITLIMNLNMIDGLPNDLVKQVAMKSYAEAKEAFKGIKKKDKTLICSYVKEEIKKFNEDEKIKEVKEKVKDFFLINK